MKKIDDEMKDADMREKAHRQEIARGRKALNRRVHPQPARDDRGEQKPWRPGDR